MAMERLRAKLMQDDPLGIYRQHGALVNPSNSGRVGTSEASVKDHYGHPDSYAVGHIFTSRRECYDAQVHRATVKGIVGNTVEGAFSVVVNDGYEDDIDEGDIIWYTGAGGQDGELEGQVADQSFDHLSNRTLQMNTITHQPVRVIRGSKNQHSPWGPVTGYRYDGLYDVLSAELVKGKSGYLICRFKLQRQPGQVPLQTLQQSRNVSV